MSTCLSKKVASAIQQTISGVNVLRRFLPGYPPLRRMKAIDLTSGNELARNLKLADTLFSRVKGLIGRQVLPIGEGLLISPCKGVHTFLMRFPIDVVFLDKNNHVIKVVENLKPYRITQVQISSRRVLELPAGTAQTSKTYVGHEVAFD